MKPISIFIPAYNAARHIENVIERIPLTLWNDIASVWIVDDGSKDNTWEAITRLSERIKKIKAVRFVNNRGYGAAAKHALSLCMNDKCEIAVCLHADGQYPPEYIPILVEKMRCERHDILQGSRIASGTALSGGMPLYKFLANRSLTFFENMLFRLNMSDYHSGFLFYSRRAIEKIPFTLLSESFDFDVEAIVCAKILGLRIGESPIPTRYADEVSYLNPTVYGFRILGVMRKYLMGTYRRLCNQAVK